MITINTYKLQNMSTKLLSSNENDRTSQRGRHRRRRGVVRTYIPLFNVVPFSLTLFLTVLLSFWISRILNLYSQHVFSYLSIFSSLFPHTSHFLLFLSRLPADYLYLNESTLTWEWLAMSPRRGRMKKKKKRSSNETNSETCRVWLPWAALPGLPSMPASCRWSFCWAN